MFYLLCICEREGTTVSSMGISRTALDWIIFITDDKV